MTSIRRASFTRFIRSSKERKVTAKASGLDLLYLVRLSKRTRGRSGTKTTVAEEQSSSSCCRPPWKNDLWPRLHELLHAVVISPSRSRTPFVLRLRAQLPDRPRARGSVPRASCLRQCIRHAAGLSLRARGLPGKTQDGHDWTD